jgi:hypothetical protein
VVAEREDGSRVSRQIKHRQSHALLLRDVSGKAAPPTRRRLNAIVVPASRPSLQRVISLSAALSVPLVVLCSRQAQAERVADRVRAAFGARALIVDVPDGYQLLSHSFKTSNPRFRDLSAGRSSDLSVKRNIGLLLARMCGWSKILFIDDDISQFRAQDIARLIGQLERHPVAAMTSRLFPDNSVVCHARRLAGLTQDVFVSGAMLGVNTQHEALSFFPDIYSEDWFFFAQQAAERALRKVGEVRQDQYEPYADPARASREEFGDLLTEGLYALFESTSGLDFSEQLSAASRSRYWQIFKEARQSMISETSALLERERRSGCVAAPAMLDDALKSLQCANDQLEAIAPEVCVDFIDCWREDDYHWKRVMRSADAHLGEREALDALGLHSSITCGYGTSRTSPGFPLSSESEPLLHSAGGKELALPRVLKT